MTLRETPQPVPEVSRADSVQRPRFAPPDIEDLLLGARRLRHAFMQTPMRFAGRDAPLIRAGGAGGPEGPSAILIRNGFACRSCVVAEGRRAIPDILLPGDTWGLDGLVLARPAEDVFAASRVGYHALGIAKLRELLDDRCILTQVLALIAEARWRADRVGVSIARLDAETRICVLLLDIHDRLRHRGLINRPTFNLPLTQEQIADHLGLTLVHVNRTLRRLRERRVVMIDRQVVIILDLARLREAAQGLPQPADMPEPAMPSESPPPQRP